MKVLVTGGAGFIGSHIVDRLVDDGANVVVLDSLDPGVWSAPPEYLRRDVRYIFQDLRHWSPDASFADVEAIVHLAAIGGVGRAAREPGNVLDANVGGTARLVSAMRTMPLLTRVVVAGSFSVYGGNYSYRVPSTGRYLGSRRRISDLEAGRFDIYDPETGEAAAIVPITEMAAPNPLETYGASKYMQELAFRGLESPPVHILRFSSVYGRRLRLDDGEATIIARLAGWIRDGVAPTLFEDGEQIRDWVYVGDIVEAVSRLIAAPTVVAGITNVCSGTPLTLLEACRVLNQAMGAAVEPRVVGGYRPGDMRHCLGDPSTLAALIGRPPTAFASGVDQTFAVGAK